MLLTQTSEYAVRAMYQLSRLPPGARLAATDLARFAEVPVSYLAKVMARLVKAGLVDGLKGHHGGFRLAHPAPTITLAQILDAIEPWEPQDRRCFYGWSECLPGNPCPLHPTFSELRECVRQWATSHHLSDFDPASLEAPGR